MGYKLCSVPGRHGGKIHQYDVQMFAKLDGTPVPNAPKEKTYICEKHKPDHEDPTFAKCRCDLCLKRMGLK